MATVSNDFRMERTCLWYVLRQEVKADLTHVYIFPVLICHAV